MDEDFLEKLIIPAERGPSQARREHGPVPETALLHARFRTAHFQIQPAVPSDYRMILKIFMGVKVLVSILVSVFIF